MLGFRVFDLLYTALAKFRTQPPHGRLISSRTMGKDAASWNMNHVIHFFILARAAF